MHTGTPSRGAPWKPFVKAEFGGGELGEDAGEAGGQGAISAAGLTLRGRSRGSGTSQRSPSFGARAAGLATPHG